MKKILHQLLLEIKPILGSSVQNFLNQIFMKFYQNTKSKDISSFCFRDVVDLNILTSDWQRIFRLISQEPNVS